MKISVLIPVYNEAETIEEAISRVMAVDLEKEIIVIDDCSRDGTVELLKTVEGITLVHHERNMGKGMAIRSGLRHARGDIVIIQDADLEYDPKDFSAMVAPIIAGQADVVYGSRFLGKKPAMRRRNYIANRILAVTANLLFGAHITDEATCYKAFRTDLIRSIPLTCRRFEFCPEVTAKLRRRGISIMEVPIDYTARTAAEGKKIGWWDGIVAMWTLLKYRILN